VKKTTTKNIKHYVIGTSRYSGSGTAAGAAEATETTGAVGIALLIKTYHEKGLTEIFYFIFHIKYLLRFNGLTNCCKSIRI
jgi:hypothetical protein